MLIIIKPPKEALSLTFSDKLQKAVYLERPNRFIIKCIIEGTDCEDKEIVSAHLPDPGRLKELLIPGKNIWLLPAKNNPKRTTLWTAALIENPSGDCLVSLDSILPNRLVAKALKEKALPVFENWDFMKAEFTWGKSRFDFLLKNVTENMALEVKSVTLVENKNALFPDAITARGRKHLEELAKIATIENWKAAVLFVVQRKDAERFLAAPEIDPAFADALKKAQSAGVKIFAIRCNVSTEKISLDKFINVL